MNKEDKIRLCPACGCYIPSFSDVCLSCSTVKEVIMYGIYKIKDPKTGRKEFTGIVGTKEEVIKIIGNHYSYDYKRITVLNEVNVNNDHLLNRRF